jgi:SNF2 family DNA or RNA helicase
VLTRDNLHEYQRRAVEFIKDNPSAALWIDMGLGKTVSTLTALQDLLSAGDIRKALVIAPLRVAQHTWPTEISLWDHLKDLSFTVLSGLPASKRAAALSENTQIHIINRENVQWICDELGQSWPYDCVVIDESSSFKNHGAKRWKSMRRILGHVDRMVQLTGTPAPNNLLELWPQIYLLDKGKRLGNTRSKFLESYCHQVGNPQWRQYEVKPHRVEALYKAVADVVLRMSAEDYIDLPERVDSVIEVSMPAGALRAYEEMKHHFIIEWDDGLVTAANAAAKVNKLLQICNGAVYDEDDSYRVVHDAKLDALREIIDTAGEPVLVAYNFRSDLERIQKALPNAVVLDKNPKTIDDWNAGKIEVLLAHPASAGHGLNLQRGGALIVWFGLSWSLELYQQFNARLYRQGQDKPVRVVHVTAKNSMDALVLEVLQGKKESQDALLEFVKK